MQGAIDHAIETAKQTRHVFAEVHRRSTENSRQCAGCRLVIIGGLEPRGDVSRYAHDADEEAKAPLSHKAQPPRKGQQFMPRTSFPQAASVSLGVENGGDHCFRIGSLMKWTVPPDSEARGRYRDHAEHDVGRREGVCCGPSTVVVSALVMMPMWRGRSR